MPDFASQRFNMVASQILANGVTQERLLDAFRQIRREAFLPAAKCALAYADAAIEIVGGRWQLEPRTFAKLVELAQITPSDTVLDVGCATGYSTAVLAKIAGRVVALEQDADLVRIASERLHEAGVQNATIVQGSLSDGSPAGGSYDAIVIEGAIEQTPQRLLAQLADGGRLVAIMQREAQGQAIIYLNEEGRVGRRGAFDASAPVLPGFGQPAAFVF